MITLPINTTTNKVDLAAMQAFTPTQYDLPYVKGKPRRQRHTRAWASKDQYPNPSTLTMECVPATPGSKDLTTLQINANGFTVPGKTKVEVDADPSAVVFNRLGIEVKITCSPVKTDMVSAADYLHALADTLTHVNVTSSFFGALSLE